eukprot:4507715-Lingulodinium_polyedra.AAC.1
MAWFVPTQSKGASGPSPTHAAPPARPRPTDAVRRVWPHRGLGRRDATASSLGLRPRPNFSGARLL